MEKSQPVRWTETDAWAEVARLAAKRGLRLEISRDPDHPLNPPASAENPWRSPYYGKERT